ncbi:hypothetical protein CEXT_98201 [Caerostris extrusa]|uniref:Uncharacterized protein n=1 Tax=Caerostris extrusa TaxID=172846 RepID=A0AAV4W1U3_CAEEX|nr:hypothetical protein CEXT_98201 [Caerostris extrusa]
MAKWPALLALAIPLLWMFISRIHDIKRKANIEKGLTTNWKKKKKNHNNRDRYPYLQRFSEIEAQNAAAESPRGQSNYTALCIALHGNAITLGAHDPNTTSMPESISSDQVRATNHLRFTEIEAQKAAAESPRGQSNYAALCIALHGNAITLGAHDPNATSIPGSISSDLERDQVWATNHLVIVIPAITVDISNPEPFPNCLKTHGTHPIKRKANIEKAPEKKNHNNRHRYPYLQRFSEIEAQKAAANSPRGESNYVALCIALHGKAITLGAHDRNATSIPGSISWDMERNQVRASNHLVIVRGFCSSVPLTRALINIGGVMTAIASRKSNGRHESLHLH